MPMLALSSLSAPVDKRKEQQNLRRPGPRSRQSVTAPAVASAVSSTQGRRSLASYNSAPAAFPCSYSGRKTESGPRCADLTSAERLLLKRQTRMNKSRLWEMCFENLTCPGLHTVPLWSNREPHLTSYYYFIEVKLEHTNNPHPPCKRSSIVTTPRALSNIRSMSERT